MELLKKSIIDSADRRKDNSDKRDLFEGHSLATAARYKEEWAFVPDVLVRENIAYQMQYLEFMVRLYNEYRVYLTLESLLCKDILVTIGGIIEAVLFQLVFESRAKEGRDMGPRSDFTVLLGMAYHELKIIDREMWHFCHELRKTRNRVHLKSADFQEHTAYTVEQANSALTKLEEFRASLIA